MVSLAHTVGSNNLQMLGGSKQTAGPVPQQSESKPNLQKVARSRRRTRLGLFCGHGSSVFSGRERSRQYLKANFWISCARAKTSSNPCCPGCKHRMRESDPSSEPTSETSAPRTPANFSQDNSMCAKGPRTVLPQAMHETTRALEKEPCKCPSGKRFNLRRHKALLASRLFHDDGCFRIEVSILDGVKSGLMIRQDKKPFRRLNQTLQPG